MARDDIRAFLLLVKVGRLVPFLIILAWLQTMNEYTLDQRQALKKMSFQEFLKTNFWFYVRRLALEATKFRCSECDSSRDPRVYHLTFKHKGFEDQHLEDLVVLCQRCYGKRHGQPTPKQKQNDKLTEPHFGGGDVTNCRPMTPEELRLFKEHRAKQGRKVPEATEYTEEQLNTFNQYWDIKEQQAWKMRNNPPRNY